VYIFIETAEMIKPAVWLLNVLKKFVLRIDQILKESKIVSKKGTNGESGLCLGIKFSKRFIILLNGEMRIDSN